MRSNFLSNAICVESWKKLYSITQNRSLKEGVATDCFHGPIELYIKLFYMIEYCLAIQELKYSAGDQTTEKAVVRVNCALAPQ